MNNQHRWPYSNAFAQQKKKKYIRWFALQPHQNAHKSMDVFFLRNGMIKSSYGTGICNDPRIENLRKNVHEIARMFIQCVTCAEEAPVLLSSAKSNHIDIDCGRA